MFRLTILRFAAAMTVAAGIVSAQSVISAQSGLLHYYEGEVTLDGKVVASKFGEFPQVKPRQVVETRLGRAELMLTPGVTLRLGENSSVRMLSSRLADTRLEFLSGSGLVEVVEPIRADHVTFLHQGTEIPLQKEGLYRLETNPPSFRVYQGQAEISNNGQTYTVKSGRELSLNTHLVEKFDNKHGDALYRWAKRRSQQLAAANISSARSVGVGRRSSGWVFNPYFGTLTFVPGYGQFMSPFGSSFWSPFSVGQFYSNYYYYNPPVYRGGWGGFNNTWTGSGWNRGAGYSRSMRHYERTGGGFHGPAGRVPSGEAGASSPSFSGRHGGGGFGRIGGGDGSHTGGGGGRVSGGGGRITGGGGRITGGGTGGH